MGALKVWDGTQWVTISRVPGPEGPQGDVATVLTPAGPAGGALANRYPNPEVSRIAAGTLLATQRVNGPSDTSTSTPVTSGTTLLSTTYTPPVDCWWAVECFLGYLSKTDAAYHDCTLNLNLSPADADGWTNRYAIKTQNSGVQQFEHRAIRHIFNLVGGTAYTASMKVTMSGGTWQYSQLWDFLHISGKAWAK
jgi:hypothetical protein